jgi:DNA topoisomerase-1
MTTRTAKAKPQTRDDVDGVATELTKAAPSPAVKAAKPAPKAKAAAKPKAKTTAKPAAKTAGAKAKKTVDDSVEPVVDEPANDVDEEAEAAPSGTTKTPRKATLLIVESPAKAKTIQKYLGRSFVVLASKGHIKDLPKRGGVDIEHGFKEEYVVIEEKGKAETLHEIQRYAKKADRVLLATDPDREGEAIAWHLLEEIKREQPQLEVKRVLFNEITKKGVQEGIAAPRELDTNLYEAQRTRRVLDRIGGYPLSNLLWRKLAFGLSAGRVQTPALRIIVDRQHEIDSFIPRAYWLLDAKLAGALPPSFTAALDSVGGEKLEKVSSRPAATSELDARRFGEDLKIASYKVSKIVRRERKSRAPAPYTTSKLQQDASTRLGMNPQRTMRTAQGLYEGVALGKGKDEEVVGLITYMRTDSQRLSNDAIEEVRQFISKQYGDNALPEKPNFFKSKAANVQDAHEAIRPTRMDLPPEVVRRHLTDERFRLYKLIWDRFVACQMVPAVYDQTSVEIEATVASRSYGLRASGSVLKIAGWRAVYGAGDRTELAGEEGENPDDDQMSLPQLTEGETLKLVEPGVTVSAKETEPPPYFNEASLVKKLEEEGIGRPSTYAEILSKVQARDYVKKDGNKLRPSELGRLVIERLVAENFDMADLDFTRKLEEGLDAIAEARGKRLDILAPFHEGLQAKIAKSLEVKGKWWPEPEAIDEKCPECSKELRKRWGKNGQFIGCDGYPECKYTRPLPGTGEGGESEDRRPELTDILCELCGAQMMKRWGRNGWFLGCSTFPKCKSTRSVPLGIACPKCGGEIVEVRGKMRKRPFYGCKNYSNAEIKCDFRIWQKPVAEDCPKCEAKLLVRAGSAKAPVLKCIAEGCGYERAVELEGEAGEGGGAQADAAS